MGEFDQFPGFDDDPTRDPLRAVDFDIPEASWVTWGGEELLDTSAPGPDVPFVEICRIECPNPRMVMVTVSVVTPLFGPVADVLIFQGIGRIDLQRNFIGLPGGTAFDLFIPTRILRVQARVNAQSPPGLLTVQAVVAPLYPWLDDRLAVRRRHKR